MNIFDSLSTNKVYYLASPYSHKTKKVMNQRYEKVNEAGALLCLMGYTIIEPIAMCHHKSLKYAMPTGYEYWKKRDRTFVHMSDGVIVLTLPGWQESVGVTDEVAYAKSLKKKVYYVSLEELQEYPRHKIAQ